jgi:hypothetical protein
MGGSFFETTRPVAAAATRRRAASTSSAAASDGEDPAKVAPKVSPLTAAHWDALLADLHRPSAARLASRLDTSRALGFPATARLTGVPALIIDLVKREAAHPTKVALTRVGEFYEAYGADAVLLVEHAGLNPMGDGWPVPKAGCPAGNLRRTLADLVEGAGLSVAVIEEAPLPLAYGRRARAKTRFLGGLVTPASPFYLGAALSSSGVGDPAAAPLIVGAPPVLGVAAGPTGFTVVEASVDLRTVSVATGQTEDAVTARLYAGGLAPPLYLFDGGGGGGGGGGSGGGGRGGGATSHRRRPAGRPSSESTPEDVWSARVAALFRREAGAVVRYGGPDPVGGLLDAVRRDVGLPMDAPFALVEGGGGGGAGCGATGRPHPLLLCTATQLGLHPTRGVPSLVDALLPGGGSGAGGGVSLAARRWLTDLLLRPPTRAVAAGVRAACVELASMTAALPRWASLPAAHVALKLRETNAAAAAAQQQPPPSADFFRDLAGVLRGVHAAAAGPAHLRRLAAALLPAMHANTGTALDLAGLAGACERGGLAIEGVVVAGEGEDAEGDADPACLSSSALADAVAANEAAYRGQVRPGLVAAELAAVVAARARVAAEAAAAAGCAAGVGAGAAVDLAFDAVNNALWLKPRRAGARLPGEAGGLISPLDRYGARVAGRWSTPGLEEAMEGYRGATAAARSAVRGALRGLTASLAPDAAGLVGACAFSVIASALTAHTRAALASGWSLVDVVDGDDEAASHSSPPLAISGAWPYWLDGRDAGTVRNDLSLDGMALLTGPNVSLTSMGRAESGRAGCGVPPRGGGRAPGAGHRLGPCGCSGRGR